MQKETDERFTPKKYIESVRFVLKSIDLDPASSELANSRIKAKNIFTKEDSGLEKSWFGNVFNNPPYSRGNLEKWCTKNVVEFEQGNMKNGILLLPNDTSTNWFKIVNKFPFCMTDHRVEFLYYNYNIKKFIYEKNPKNGSLFILFSYNLEILDQFIKEFTKHGPIFSKVQ